MKNKINTSFMMMVALSIVLTTMFITVIYYQVFKKEVFENLKNFCYVLDETGVFEADDITPLKNYAHKSSNLRITLITEEGLVAFDTNDKVDPKDNHKDRPEIKSALQNGTGKCIRTSSTINKSNYY